MNFVPDIEGQARGGPAVESAFRAVADDLGLVLRGGRDGVLRCEYTPGSYEPIEFAFRFPEGLGILAVEGALATFEGQPSEELRLAINYLNAEVQTYRFYVSEGEGPSDSVLLVRHDLLPNLDEAPPFHPRELRQILAGLCAQKAIFADTLLQIQEGRPWRLVKDALRALR
ncbi:MAG: hypothetical protein D6731_02320 [Planctomycetota bacterium]|nr:MAG: hypothetical protein D6731_02320 [Planctomycetota bacterium]